MDREARINERIRAKEVRVISSKGDQLGIMPLKDALKIAQAVQLDLVEVAPDANPPVCRIMDYGKYRYEQSKRSREARKKQRIIQVKEIKLRPTTEEHDYQFKVRHLRRFLEEGNKAKVTVMFKGREMVHTEIGGRVLERLVEDLKDLAVVEQKPRIEGRNLVMVLAPDRSKGKGS